MYFIWVEMLFKKERKKVNTECHICLGPGPLYDNRGEREEDKTPS